MASNDDFNKLLADLATSKSTNSTPTNDTSNDTSNDSSNDSTSTLGATGRGILNALTLGLGDDALTGISKVTGTHDYGKDLRTYEDMDKTQHPYARLGGEIAGSVIPMLIPGSQEAEGARLVNGLRSAYMNPAINSAISNVGNNNDLVNGDISGAAKDAAIGGVSGEIIGKALDTIGNKLSTGSFTKNSIDTTPIDQRPIADRLNASGVSTPYQYNPDNSFGNIIGKSIQNSTRNTSSGVQANQDLMNEINRQFPFMVGSTSEPDSIATMVASSLNQNKNGFYNAVDLKNALDDAVNGSFKDAHEKALSNDAYNGIDSWEQGHEIMSDPLYKLASDAAPIHQDIMNNINPNVKQSTGLNHVLSLLPGGIGLAMGHVPLGILGSVLMEGLPKVSQTIGAQIGENAIRNKIADPLGAQIPDISETRKVIGDFVQNRNGPIVGNITSSITSSKPAQSNDNSMNSRSKLKDLGYTDEQINSIMQ